MLPEADVNAPGMFFGAERIRDNRAAFLQAVVQNQRHLIPEAAASEIICEQDLFARHNAGVTLRAKAVFKPSKEFHTVRHTLYSADENMEIDKVVPVAASVKTKLGKGETGEE